MSGPSSQPQTRARPTAFSKAIAATSQPSALGEVVGELSLIDGKPTSASVVAETAVEALALYRTRFNELFDSTPELARNLLVGLAERVRETDRRANLTG